MNRLQQAVLDFNKKGGQYVADGMGLPDAVAFETQCMIFEEEFNEMIEAYNKGDFVEVVDGLIDSIYVLVHFSNMIGLDIDPLFDEVHRSNMSKADPVTGEFIMKDGKIQKGPAYSKPDLESVLDEAASKYRYYEHFEND